ncbi:ABC transporter permease [Clostridium sp. 19966]|uniref:ABC transporter permease n=1 Tax=Clostridium sp. 19966 TaxID=2768166 RepID=UPI0028E31989|nr:ABC transporter permease [Clostridium sp. 19966]
MQILTMISKQLKLLFRNRLTILATISIPLILTYLFSFSGSSSQQKLYVADLDNSAASKQLISLISNHKGLNVIKASESEVKNQIDEQNASIGLIIGKNFGEALISGDTSQAKIVQNYEDIDSISINQLIASQVSSLEKIYEDSKYLAGVNIDAASFSSSTISNIKASSSSSYIKDESTNNSLTTRFIGFLVMFIWFAIVQGFRTILEERENNTFERILSLPTRYSKYLISKVIACYIFAMCNLLIILAAGEYFLKISVGSNLISLLTVLSAYILLLTGITLLLAMLIKKHQNFTISSAILIASTGILGGSFFSLDIAPNYMQLISKITPEAWAINSSNDILFSNGTLASQTTTLIVFAAAAIIFFAASALSLNKKSVMS